ncbi:MAG: hypothetical protein NC192_10635, partial [Muribaculaceae bacterium]|nr:hypothetical protein [Muribaculaceae bacterium]
TADNMTVTGSGTESVTENTQNTETEKNAEVSLPAVKDGKIVIDSGDLAWSMAGTVFKETVQQLDGDVRVTLKLKYFSENADEYRGIRVLESNSVMSVKGVALNRDVSGTYVIEGGVKEFVFIIPEELKNNMTESMRFDCTNVTVESAVLEEEKYDKTFGFEDFGYPEDWNAMAYIPIEELTGYGGDVRITVDAEIGKYAEGDSAVWWVDGVTPISWIHPVETDGWAKLNISADNLPQPDGDDMYLLKGTGERKFSFAITQEELKRCGNTLAFQVYNCVVKKVSIKSAEADVNTASAAEPKYIPLNDAYQGDWNYSKAIKKTSLKDFTGDVKVTLDVELVEEDAWSVLQFEDGTGKAVDIQACNTGRDYDNNYIFFKGQTQFAFVVTRETFDKIGREIRMQGSNVWVKGAAVENYNPQDDEPSSGAKIIELDGKYQGHWQNSTPIPKKELAAFGGDVRVTLNLEIVKEDLEPQENNRDNSEYWVQITPNTPRGDGSVHIKADYVTPCSWAEDMYVLYDVNVPDKFTFVITEEEIARLDNVGLCFIGSNFIVKSAALESEDVSTAYTEPVSMVLNKECQLWHNNEIDKDALKNFKGDIRATLDIERIDPDVWTAVAIERDMNVPLDIQAYNMGRDYMNRYVFYPGQTEFSFIIPKKEFDGIDKKIIYKGQNLLVKKAVFEDYNPKDDEPSPDATVIQLDSEYPGYWVDSKTIPKNVLEEFNGDVRITLYIDYVKRDLVPDNPNDNHNGSEYWLQIQAKGNLAAIDRTIFLNADYITPCTWYDGMYVLFDNAVPDRFTFVITSEQIAKLDGNYGLAFAGNNFIAKSACLEKA